MFHVGRELKDIAQLRNTLREAGAGLLMLCLSWLCLRPASGGNWIWNDERELVWLQQPTSWPTSFRLDTTSRSVSSAPASIWQPEQASQPACAPPASDLRRRLVGLTICSNYCAPANSNEGSPTSARCHSAPPDSAWPALPFKADRQCSLACEPA